MQNYSSILLLSFFISLNVCAHFVKVNGTQFEIQNKPYTYLGTNFWYGLNLGIEGDQGNRSRLIRELDRLKKLGVKNLRVMAGTEGPDSEPYRMTPSMQKAPGVYDEKVVIGLDFLLSEMSKRNMKAVMCLTNFWNWSGGMAQYLIWAKAAKSIPYPPPHPGGSWSEYQTFTSQFYKNELAQKYLQNHIKYIVQRTNTITGIFYKNDPTIMSWELANEPRGDKFVSEFRKWIHETAKFIKSLDKNHLVTTGSEGDTPFPSAGTDLLKDHESPYIDYATIHIWVQNWMIYNPQHQATLDSAVKFAFNYIDSHDQKSMKLNKPLVLEEFGISRDKNNHEPTSSTINRDLYYKSIFSKVEVLHKRQDSSLRGVNFWAWAGEGRPKHVEGLWEAGDDFIGDPPHEFQGWYSIYDKDKTTNMLIKEYATKINSQSL